MKYGGGTGTFTEGLTIQGFTSNRHHCPLGRVDWYQSHRYDSFFLFVGLFEPSPPSGGNIGAARTPRHRSLEMSTQVERAHGLEALGITRSGRVHWNLSPAVLYETALRRNEAILAADGPLVARTGQHTGRSPLDKFTVKEPTTEMNVHWGNVNRPVDEVHFDTLHRDMMNYVQDKELYVLDAWGGADPAYRSGWWACACRGSSGENHRYVRRWGARDGLPAYS